MPRILHRNIWPPAIHAAHGAELAALATSDPAKAEGFSIFAPGLSVHSSYDALLADPTTRTVMGASGRKVVDDNRGAVARLMQFLEPLLP